MQSARAARVVRALALRRAAPSRLMSGGHGHGAPKSSAPGKPYQHPDYTGPEAYVRYWLPENHHLVYAVLGIYLHLVAFALYRNGKAADKALEALPGPDMPDYTTPLPVSSSLPEFGTAEWEALLATPEGPQALIDAGLAFLA